ncbi:MAG TPA: recombinase family protein [Symbiobacteriaceae bacterium]|jgi:site-specific DNA recombinase
MQVRAYVRVSTDEQAQEGFSIPTQKQRVTDYCRAVFEQTPPITWYVDEGFSAKNMVRPAITRLRAEVRATDTVLVLRLDRLTRSVADLYTLLNEWNQKGVTFRSVTESFNTDTPEGRFMVTLLASLAQWERERIAERVREVMTNIVKTDQRHLSRAPFGYGLVDKQLVINASEAAVVRMIFDLYLQERGTRAIAVWLNQQGIKTKQGCAWTDFAVSYILRNPVYAGKVAWARVMNRGKRRPIRLPQPEAIIVDGLHVPVISPQTWAAAQETAARRQTRPPRSATGRHPLTGLTYCGLCGGPVHGFVQRRYRGGQWVPELNRAYYRCSNRDHHKTCTLRYFAAEQLEGAVIRAIGLLAAPERLREIAQAFLSDSDADSAREQINALQAELRQLDRKRKRWDDAYESGDISREEWRERTTAIRQRQEAVRGNLAGLTAAASEPLDVDEVARTMGDLARVWAALAPEERKTVLHGLLERVTVDAAGNATVRPRVFGDGLGSKVGDGV